MAENQATASAPTPAQTEPQKKDEPWAEANGAVVPEDEINLLELVYVLVKYKIIIILFSALGLVGGYFAAKAKGPTYTANAVLTAKASESPRPNLGALGAFGGIAAAQLNLAGNPGLEKLELYLNSREFNAELIEKYDLITDIFKFAPKAKTRKVYEMFFDTTANKWMESDTGFTLPTPLQMAGFLTSSFFNVETDIKSGTMTISVKSSDSLFSIRTLAATIEHLDVYIRRDVQNEAKANVDYLEQQLVTIYDPLLRTKMQEMIASEIEKAMIVNREAFKVIDSPFCWKSFRERMLFPIAGAFGMFMLTAGAVIFFNQVFGAGNTNPESRKWVDRIKKQLFRII